MGRSNETFNKKEKEKKKLQKKKEKLAKKEARKAEGGGGSSLDDMIAYVDENGVIVDTPPDPNKKKKVIKAENIVLGVPKKEDVEEQTEWHGKVTFFNDEKGYGFIKDADSAESYFVHINNVQGGEINEGDKVEFETEPGPKGMVAVNVKRV